MPNAHPAPVRLQTSSGSAWSVGRPSRAGSTAVANAAADGVTDGVLENPRQCGFGIGEGFDGDAGEIERLPVRLAQLPVVVDEQDVEVTGFEHGSASG